MPCMAGEWAARRDAPSSEGGVEVSVLTGGRSGSANHMLCGCREGESHARGRAVVARLNSDTSPIARPPRLGRTHSSPPPTITSRTQRRPQRPPSVPTQCTNIPTYTTLRNSRLVTREQWPRPAPAPRVGFISLSHSPASAHHGQRRTSRSTSASRRTRSHPSPRQRRRPWRGATRGRGSPSGGTMMMPRASSAKGTLIVIFGQLLPIHAQTHAHVITAYELPRTHV
ncbi:hypothetical protein CALCODRAFT_31443 [Calocera cornea HHB12733]|uniref:Uncharacterized protein n=1 Tax=Calocera cornea HHB12733 TaxID=1353952 RepID=A0A165E1R3_9BASI|nr:hypothetical protein CALCODRAFT_31443 [Calocera cornea HHB12733]